MSRHVAIVGNPNCGKTTLFNTLTGSGQKIGNWAGVTVDKKQGQYHHKQHCFKVTDLPGTYALNTTAQSALDERVVCEFIMAQQADLYVNIIDAANLKRNLYLTLQLLEMGVPCIIALNMTDIAKQRGIRIDTQALSQLTNCPVIPIIANKKQGITTLCDAIAAHSLDIAKPTYTLTLPPVLNKGISHLSKAIQQQAKTSTLSPNALALRLLEQDTLAKQQCHDLKLNAQIDTLSHTVEQTTGEECDILIADARYCTINQIVTQCVQQRSHLAKTFTQRVDSLLMHRWLGIPCFLLIMYAMFEFSMNIGTLLQPFFDITSKVIFMDGAQYLGQLWHLPTWLVALTAQGVGLGINTVVNFIPQIGLMFLFLAFLEDSGYMARAAFVMDKFMQFVGLPGKSFVPLIIGFGCNVPSIMATRTLACRRDRLLTAMMSPFMSCGARLAIFIVFAQAFFPQHGGLVVFLLYIIGIMAAMLTGFLFKNTVLRGKGEPFFMELPVYHRPTWGTIWRLTNQKLKRFVIRAGKVIVPMCVLIGTLNAIQPNGHIVPTGSQQSVLSQTARQITPILQPMGITQDNWPATVGIITGFLAKEVVVGTLNTLYSQDLNQQADLDDFHFWPALGSAVTETVSGFTRVFSSDMINPFTANEADHDMSKTAMHTMSAAFVSPIAAFAYLLFILLYIPCASALATLMREIGKGWAYLTTAWSLLLAYTLAVMFYQTSIWSYAPVSASGWILFSLLLNAAFVFALKQYGFRKYTALSDIPVVAVEEGL